MGSAPKALWVLEEGRAKSIKCLPLSVFGARTPQLLPQIDLCYI